MSIEKVVDYLKQLNGLDENRYRLYLIYFCKVLFLFFLLFFLSFFFIFFFGGGGHLFFFFRLFLVGIPVFALLFFCQDPDFVSYQGQACSGRGVYTD